MQAVQGQQVWQSSSLAGLAVWQVWQWGRSGKSGINLPAERGWVSKNLPQGPRPEGAARGPRAEGQVFADSPELCWQVDHSCSSNRMLGHFTS